MISLQYILDKYSFPKRTVLPATDIDSIEGIFNFKLPQDYKYFISNYQGYEEFIGKKYMVLWDIDELVKSNKALSIQEYLPSCFAIGGDGAGELIVLEHVGLNATRVILTPMIGMSKEDCIEIGSSFSDFLIRLEAGREWFDF